MAGTVVVLQGLVEPLQDPVESLREGSIRAAACFPQGRAIHALAVTETTRAAIPFYSGRRVDLVRRREDVPGHLEDAGGTLFLVDDREWAEGAVRRSGSRAERVATIRLNARHAVRVMRWLP
jgi:hypothetical protein